MSIHRYAVIRCMYNHQSSITNVLQAREPSPSQSAVIGGRLSQVWQHCNRPALSLVVTELSPTNEPTHSPDRIPNMKLITQESGVETCLELVGLSAQRIASAKLAVWQSIDLQLWIRYTRSDGVIRKFRLSIDSDTTFRSCLAVLSRFMDIKATHATSALLQLSTPLPCIHQPSSSSTVISDTGQTVPFDAYLPISSTQSSSSLMYPLDLHHALYDLHNIPESILKECWSKLAGMSNQQLRQIPWLKNTNMDMWAKRVEHELRLATLDE
ncbi:hypothetical protein BDV3_000354 [Batrachochytrium dendrobatidis]